MTSIWRSKSTKIENGVPKFVFICRKKLQVNLQMSTEQSGDVFAKMLNQPDLSDRTTDVQALIGQLEQGGYSQDSLQQLAKKVFSAKQPTLVSIGNLKTMPYIDDLKA